MAEFYSLDQAARELGMSAEELKAKAQHREVRAFMDGGSWRFRKADIDELARRRGMGSDPDLSLSDLDLVVPTETGGIPNSGSEELLLSEFQLGVANPDPTPPSVELAQEAASDGDVLVDDISQPVGPLDGSSSTIIGMKPAGKQPSDSDVRLVPDNVAKGASDSDVRLASPLSHGLAPSESGIQFSPATPMSRAPSDSDVTIASDGGSASSDEIFTAQDPGETTLRPSPLLGSSGEVAVPDTDQSDSDFELTPSSVIDALEPESGSDFELTALDGSDEFEATPMRGPGDSDVTGAEPSTSGINLARPSDSGINLQAVGGGFGLDADSIELAPLDEDDGPQRPAAKPAPKPAPKPAAKPRPDDLSATALPGKALDDLSATALPIKAEKDIFEDTDFEVDALDSGGDDRTVQLEAQSDFDLEDRDSASEVFAIDEEDVDQNAATAMGPSVLDDDAEGGFGAAEADESPSAWDVEPEPTPSASAAPAARPVLAATGPGPEWGGLWVTLLAITTVFMMLLAFVGMDVVRNLYDFRGEGPASGIVKQLAGLMGG